MIARNTSFLDYYKVILQKVSFDEELFVKEYQKALSYLEPDEISVLNRWIILENMDHLLKKHKFIITDPKGI